MHTDVRIVVRTRVDWRHIDEKAFSNQTDPTRPLLFIAHAIQRDLVGVFARVFGIDYFTFRAVIRDLAFESIRAIRDAKVTIGFEDFEDWFLSGEDELIFPVDDDDIFHPALVQSINLTDSTPDLVMWKHAAVGYGAHQRLPAVHRWDERVLFSNNWGIRKSFLRRLLPVTEARRFLACHRTAQATMARTYGIPVRDELGEFGVFVDLDHYGVEHINAYLGLQLFHIGSLAGFWSRSREANTELAFQEIDLTAPIELPGELQWANAFVRQYERFMSDIAQRRFAK